jgi:hypothetical protein
MTPFRHRRIRRRKKLRYPAAPQPDRKGIEKGRAESGKFVPSEAADRQAHLNTHQYPQDRADYPKNPFWNAVNPTLELSDETILRLFGDATRVSEEDIPEEPAE